MIVLDVRTIVAQSRVKRLGLLAVLGAAVLLVTASCASIRRPPATVQVGQSREAVIQTLGEPDEIRDFAVPDAPFFGPQERLQELLPPGSPVEEWRYASGDDVRYIWFSGNPGSRDEWRVVDSAVYPADAVY